MTTFAPLNIDNYMHISNRQGLVGALPEFIISSVVIFSPSVPAEAGYKITRANSDEPEEYYANQFLSYLYTPDGTVVYNGGPQGLVEYISSVPESLT